MKKLLITLIMVMMSINIFANTSNYREVGSFTTFNETEIVVGVDMRRITRIQIKGELTLYLDEVALSNFGVMLQINAGMIDKVTADDIDIIYSRNTDRFGWSAKTLFSYFRVNGEGGEESCFIKFRYLEQTAGQRTAEFMLQASDIRELQRLISDAKTEADNITNQIMALDAELEDLGRY